MSGQAKLRAARRIVAENLKREPEKPQVLKATGLALEKLVQAAAVLDASGCQSNILVYSLSNNFLRGFAKALGVPKKWLLSDRQAVIRKVARDLKIRRKRSAAARKGWATRRKFVKQKR